MIVLLALALAIMGDLQPAMPKTAAEAIALVDANPRRAAKGVFTMTVVAAERRRNALYLNSSEDYRSSGNMTIQLSPAAARNLAKRLGAEPETALIGKTVTVRGEIRAVPIVNMVNGRPQTFNRLQHTVMIRKASELTVQ